MKELRKLKPKLAACGTHEEAGQFAPHAAWEGLSKGRHQRGVWSRLKAKEKVNIFAEDR